MATPPESCALKVMKFPEQGHAVYLHYLSLDTIYKFQIATVFRAFLLSISEGVSLPFDLGDVILNKPLVTTKYYYNRTAVFFMGFVIPGCDLHYLSFDCFPSL